MAGANVHELLGVLRVDERSRTTLGCPIRHLRVGGLASFLSPQPRRLVERRALVRRSWARAAPDRIVAQLQPRRLSAARALSSFRRPGARAPSRRWSGQREAICLAGNRARPVARFLRRAEPLLSTGSSAVIRFAAIAAAGLVAAACGTGSDSTPRQAASGSESDYAALRHRMVAEQLAPPRRDIVHPGVLRVMGEVARHEFVPDDVRSQAYEDTTLPIGYDQTISQPYIVAFMTAALDPKPTDRVLEIGTGSGYHAAVISRLVAEVYTIEIVEPLASRATATLARLGYTNVHVRAGDGYRGWPDEA